MKKVFAVLLAAVMMLTCIPLVFAEDVITEINFDESRNFTKGNELESLEGYDRTYTINSGVTMTVPEGMTLAIPGRCELIVAEGGTLKILGDVFVTENGKLTVNGTILHSDRVSGAGSALARVTFPAPTGGTTAYPSGFMKVFYGYGSVKDDYLNATYYEIPAAGKTVYIPLNKLLFVKTDIVYDGDLANIKYDDLKVTATLTNNGALQNVGTDTKYVKVLDAGSITYGRYTSDEAFLKDYTVVLNPKETKGYTVYDLNGNTDNVTVAYGKPFTFKIEFDPDYSYAATTAEIYIYNGKGVVNYQQNSTGTAVQPTKPDAAGNYTIPAITGDYTIYVSWLPMDDATVSKVGGILQSIRSVFEMIINFFRSIMNMFKIGG